MACSTPGTLEHATRNTETSRNTPEHPEKPEQHLHPVLSGQ